MFLSLRKYDLGCSSLILTFYQSQIQGSKRHRISDLDPQHCSDLAQRPGSGFDIEFIVRIMTTFFTVQTSPTVEINDKNSALVFNNKKIHIRKFIMRNNWYRYPYFCSKSQSPPSRS